MKPKVKPNRLIYVIALVVLFVAVASHVSAHWVASREDATRQRIEAARAKYEAALPALEARLIRMAEANPMTAMDSMNWMTQMGWKTSTNMALAVGREDGYHLVRRGWLAGHLVFKRLSLLADKLNQPGAKHCLLQVADALLDTYSKALTRLDVGSPLAPSGCPDLSVLPPLPKSDWSEVAPDILLAEQNLASNQAWSEYSARGHDSLVGEMLRLYSANGRKLPYVDTLGQKLSY